MKIFNLDEILLVMQRKKYIVFEYDGKPYNLNLIGVRNSTPVPNSFDDRLYVLWRFHGEWNGRNYSITTDPGLMYLKKPINPAGTAILKEGQYKGMWQIGMHRGKYPALVQVGPCVVIRDFNRDNRLDFDSKKEQKGSDFGINLHRSLKDMEASVVGEFSAGCQVFSNPHNFNEVMAMARVAEDNFGNSFTYTLINERDFS